jgi:hypothetical protein
MARKMSQLYSLIFLFAAGVKWIYAIAEDSLMSHGNHSMLLRVRIESVTAFRGKT